MTTWGSFTGDPNREPFDYKPGASPPWRPSRGKLPGTENASKPTDRQKDRGSTFRAEPEAVRIVNAALHLRRPILITGKAGTGKSSLIYAVARELRLGEVLRWSVTSRSTLQQGLYQYDAIARLHETKPNGERPPVGDFIRLGPLGTALLPRTRPAAVLIDEIDKSDIDLPNDLLNIFEEGEFYIPELERLNVDTPIDVKTATGELFPITRGHVQCHEFPFVVLTSNGEREFPPPFLRRCLRLDMPEPTEDSLSKIVELHLGKEVHDVAKGIIGDFLARRSKSTLATDQLLNAVFLVKQAGLENATREEMLDILLRALSTTTNEPAA